jgi:hypothetical protein
VVRRLAVATHVTQDAAHAAVALGLGHAAAAAGNAGGAFPLGVLVASRTIAAAVH